MHVRFWSGNLNDTDKLKYVIVNGNVKGKGKSKVHTKTSHGGTQGE